MYAKIVNDTVIEFPYPPSKVRKDYPGTSFPQEITDATLAEWDILPVVVVGNPNNDEATENAVLDTPMKAGNRWQTVWKNVPKSQEEKDRYTRRKRRDDNVGAIKADPAALALLRGSPTEVDAAIDAVVTIEDVKGILRILSKAVAALSYNVVD